MVHYFLENYKDEGLFNEYLMQELCSGIDVIFYYAVLWGRPPSLY